MVLLGCRVMPWVVKGRRVIVTAFCEWSGCSDGWWWLGWVGLGWHEERIEEDIQVPNNR